MAVPRSSSSRRPSAPRARMRRAVQSGGDASLHAGKGAHLPCRGSESTARFRAPHFPTGTPHWRRISPPHTGGGVWRPKGAGFGSPGRRPGSGADFGRGPGPRPGATRQLRQTLPPRAQVLGAWAKGQALGTEQPESRRKAEQGSFKFGRPLPKGHRQWVQGRDRAGGKPEHRGAESRPA